MANEITQANGQIRPYGGPQVTITGSTIGAAAASIYSLGAGGYQLWKSGQAEFLNTLKTLVPGNAYIVKPKAVPMDFPPPAEGTTTVIKPNPEPYTLSSAVDAPLVDTGFFGRLEFNRPTVTLSNVPAGWTLELTLDGGQTYLSAAQVTSALAGLSDAAIQAGVSINYRLTKTSATAGSLTITYSY